jgi:hypothetical protein
VVSLNGRWRFIKDAARAAKFSICINYDSPHSRSSSLHYADEKTENEDKQESASANKQIIGVEVPTFADRTRFLRRRLAVIQKRLGEMERLKLECDREARRGAQQMAMGGFGMLVVYWGAVARLTFYDYGWWVAICACALFLSVFDDENSCFALIGM